MKLLITISGSAGTGKTTQAKILAEKYNLKYVSAGSIFRQIAKERNLSLEEFSKQVLEDESIDLLIDKRIKEIAREGNVVLEGRLTAWMTKETDALRIYLKAPLEVEIKRIAERDNKSIEEARKETIAREESEKQRYYKIYGIDITDLSIYDIILNTEIYNIESVSRILEKAVDEYIKNKKISLKKTV
ncbi:MAG: (d)CMP kinase [Candidatus Odinarchaeia archaeon]